MRQLSPEEVEIGSQRLEDFYFLVKPEPFPDWVGEPRAPSPTEVGNVTHLFTDDESRTPHIREALLRLIRSAREKLLFCSFIFADDIVVDALCEAAERLHGGVYVLTDLDKDMRPDMSDLGEEIPDYVRRQRERRERHEAHLRKLAKAGVWLRSLRSCHAKFCVRDDEEAVLTSANATREAYCENPENGLLLREPMVARELGRLFAHVWLHLATGESTPGSELHLCSLSRTGAGAWRPLPALSILRPICTLAREEHSIRERTLELINGAQRELVIASYSAVSLKDHAVGQALRQALVQRGVRILLVLRSRNLSEDQRRTCAWLFGGLHPDQWCLRAHGRTHAKAIVADGARALVWTGNLDGQHGYDSGIEVGVESDQPALAGVIRAYVVALARRSPQIGELYPSLAQVAETEPRSIIRGEWSVKVPAGLGARIPDLAHQLSRHRVAHFRVGAQWVIRVGSELFIRATRNDAARAIELSDVWDEPFLRDRQLEGFFGSCRMTLVRLPPGTRPHREKGHGHEPHRKPKRRRNSR